MKKIINLIFITSIILFSFVFTVHASGSEHSLSVKFMNNTVNIQKVYGENFLFLPAGLDLNELVLNVEGFEDIEVSGSKGTALLKSGEAVDVTALTDCDSLGIYTLTIKLSDASLEVKIIKSSKISSMFINSDDPENFGREYVAEERGNAASGNIEVYSHDGETIYIGGLKEIKGRGNSTWDGSLKKPYQIKLSQKANLLNDGNNENSQQTWILLANSFDPTLIRNQLTYDLAKEIGMAYSPESIPIDVYYDGEYIGAYLLSEKNEISEGRININNLEKEIENAGSPDIITYAKDTNQYGNVFKYAEGVVVPDYAEYGFLLEYEYADRVDDENCWFSTKNGNYVVIKSPENLPKSFVKKISERYQEFEDAVYNGGVNPNNGRPYEDYVNIDSLVKMFTIEQFSKDIDAFISSTYMYLDDNMEFNYGPVWDFDISYGIGSTTEADENQKVTGFTVFNTDFGKKLMNIESFNNRYIKFYNNEFSPLIEDVILGDKPGNFVLSVSDYVENIYQSQIMNYLIWDYVGFNGNAVEWVFDNYDENVNFLERFISDRHKWTKTALNSNHCLDDIKTLNVYTYYDSLADETYFSLSESDYFVAKILTVENGFISIKHLSGIEYSDHLEVYVNGTKTDYIINDTECVIIPVPESHNIMPPKKEGVVFKDVSSDSWYYNYVYNVYNKGWMKGVTEKRFQPAEALKKGMVITALFRMSGSDSYKNKFTVSSECYNDAATWAVQNHIIGEYEKEFMEFSRTITRQEAAVLFYRAYGSPEVVYDLSFEDTSDISDYSANAVKWCVKNGIFSGDNTNKLNPEQSLSRAEFAKMLSIYAELKSE